MIDLIIKEGTIYTSTGSYKADIAVKDEKIFAIGNRETFEPAKKEIDATGLSVLPGVWHPHCHFRDPGFPQKEDFKAGSSAAAAGGITFIIDQTNTDPHPSTVEAFELKKGIASSKSIVDFGIYGAGLHPEEIDKLAKAGAIAIKTFNTRHPKDAYPYISDLAVTDTGLLYEIYEATAKAGLMIAVHHDDSDWCRRMVFRDYIDQGKIDNKSYMEAYEKGYMYGHGMVAGLAVSLYYARLAKVPLYVLHLGVMPEYAYELIRHAKEQGQEVYAELEATAMLMDREQAEKVGPATYLWAYNPEPAWKSIRNGITDTVVIEHAPHSKEEVEVGWDDNFSSPLGVTGVQEFLPLMLNEVNKGRLTMEELVHFTSENPAKIYGMYPNKGVIQVGADADFTIVDLNAKGVLTSDDMHSNTGFTSWEGVEVQGLPVHTIVRGHHVAERGNILVEQGFGKFVPGIRYEKSLTRK